MLKYFRVSFPQHMQAAASSFNYLCNKPFATMMTIVVIAITLALPALFWVFADNLQTLTANWKQGGRISLYLKLPSTPVQEEAVLRKVSALQGVAHADLKTPAQGLAELQSQEGMPDITNFLLENPLPAVIEVTPAANMSTPEKLQQLHNELKANPEVEQAKLDIQWVSRLHAVLGLVAKMAYGLIILLASAVILIICNTLRLAIQNRHEEIQVLKLIGGADPFIARPFLYAGIWYGLAGAVLAVFLVNIFMLSLAVAVKQLAAVYQMHYPLLGLSVRQALLLILSATILGWLGARLSVKRQLSSIEPYN
ncbi:permease-like cell division protein FtsX [Legionella septentrionalis]|uniref:permease-like cell division protein FtsX n=1 Tax=Legionella septentrionalis TaxID=2498109 RepID=UPI0038995E4C